MQISMHQLMEQNQECKCFMDYSAENRPVIINSPSSIAGDYPADKIHLIQVMWDYQLSLLLNNIFDAQDSLMVAQPSKMG
jgi:thiamine monophosphate synthase